MSAFDTKPSGDAHAGEEFFFGTGRCSTCHMVHGRGQVNGPDLSDIGRKSTVRELELVLENPTSQMGIHTTPTCPSWAFCPDETWGVVNVKLRDGQSWRGFARGRAEHDLELQTFDGRLHFLTDKQYQEITPEKTSYMPPLQASAGERRNVVAYLSSLGGVQPGALDRVDTTISSVTVVAGDGPLSVAVSTVASGWVFRTSSRNCSISGSVNRVKSGLAVTWMGPPPKPVCAEEKKVIR
jgi:hypothetical protein